MQSPNSTSTFTGLLKEVYGDKLLSLAPTKGPILTRLGFDQKDAIGNKFHQPVDLQLEQGFSYGAANSTLSLLGPISGQMQDAQVDGSQIIGQASINYEIIYKAAQAGTKAFKSATEALVKRLSNSAVKRRELQVMHGQEGLGTLSAVSGAGTTRTWTITAAEWAPGIWAGMVGAQLDVYTSAFALRNTNAAVVITSINIASNQISVSGNATDLTAIVATDVLFFRQASPTTEAAGLGKILSNTSGTLFNINASTYEMWGGNVYSSTGAFSLPKLLDACSLPANYGASGKITAVVSPKVFETLNSDQSTLRRYGANYRSAEGENGFEGLTFHSQIGVIEVMPHYLQKNGKAYIFMEDEAKRIGSTDITFVKRPGTNDTLIMESSTQGASEMRVFSQEALFIEQPRHTVIMTGIT